MIRARTSTEGRKILHLGDEPRDLALGRILADAAPSREIVFPAKGEVAPPTSLDLEDAEWLVSRLGAGLSPDRSWLRDLASVDAGRGEAPGGAVSLTGLREIRVLLASARRSAAHDLPYAFEALSGTPNEIRRDPRLRAFREECARATSAALRHRPLFAWRVALVPLVCAEAVEDIVAARWRDRLTRYVILAANTTYAAGRVTYAFRSPASLDAAGILLAALPTGLPPPRTERGGTAGRGALPAEDFRRLLAGLRFRRPSRLLE